MVCFAFTCLATTRYHEFDRFGVQALTFCARKPDFPSRLLAKAKLEEEKWYRTMAGVAFESLSFSEVEAIEEIFKKLTENENIVVASKIADDLGITRSVIVNALRKFESAGIIESRSLGMKGTYIQLKNPCVLEEIAGRSAKLKAAFERQ